MNILVTGCAGFIGFSLSEFLLKKGHNITGIDNFDDYYSVQLKKKRVKILKKYKKFKFKKVDISKKHNLFFLKKIKYSHVFHFAAQAGVRYSLINPKKYYNSNVLGYLNLILTLNKMDLKKVIYASSSSVYGEQKKYPTTENMKLNAKNPYANSKVINEIMSKIFAESYNINFIGLRFFTVYGEWGRPDMFIIKLLNCISKKKTFQLNNSGDHYRDFTYISDILKGCQKLINYQPKSLHTIFNICAGKKINILQLTQKIISYYPKAKIKNILANKADVYQTFGSNKKIVKELKLKKFIKLEIGLKNTIKWFNKYNIQKLI